MAVPKRRHSKERLRKKRSAKCKRAEVKPVLTEDKKGYKRPHFDEYIEV